MVDDKQLRVCIVGAGTQFLGGISYYTLYLINALAKSYYVSGILMRKLLPTRLYPGWKRVGTNLTELAYDSSAQIFDGVDWYWLPSMLRCAFFLKNEQPEVVVFQWWSGTVLHSYLLIALIAKLLKARIIIEFHEVQDPGEAKLPLAQLYTRALAPFLIRMAHGFVIHSEYDRELLQRHYDLKGQPIVLIPHGSYHHYQLNDQDQVAREAPESCCNLLFFGLIRPYKGLDNLIKAFDALPENEVSGYWLTIVGETWEGWTTPAGLIKQSRYHNRITFVNRYVSDAEVSQHFAGADALVLPYHRSSSSGPLHIAMSHGLPVVVTRVGGLIEAVADYEGAILVAPEDPTALRDALMHVKKLDGRRYTDPRSWEQNTLRYHALFEAIGLSTSPISLKYEEWFPTVQSVQRQRIP